MDMAGANFVTIGEEGLDIQSIVMTGDKAQGGSYIMWWDAEAGKYSAKAVYANPLCNPDDDEDLDYGGWGDANDWYPIEKTFTPGQGFWFQAAFDNVSLTTSGEVEQPETEYAGRALKKNKMDIVVNPFPVSVDIQSIVMDGDKAQGGSYIMWWDPVAGKFSAKAVYANPLCNPDDDEDLDYGGWGDELDWYPIEKTFAPGQGFWTQAAFDNVTICFPNPFKPAK